MPVGGVRLRMLLARLALDPGRFVPVDTLVDGLWGEWPPADAGNALQSLVSRLRRTIRDATGTVDIVLSGPAGYQLAVADDDVDVVRFDRLTGEGRSHLRAGRPVQAEVSFAEALRLWQGTALAEVADAPFAAPVAARLGEAWLAAAEDWCEAVLTLGRPEDALAQLDRLVAGRPLRERLVALRMRALASVGRTVDALADFEQVRRALATELGIDPSTELRDAHLAVLRGQQKPQTRGRAELPAPLTSFVGRDAELADARALLAANRLVSLVGAGGAGKTRLAVELAARASDELGSRVWFVELAPVRSDAGLTDLATAVLSALDLREVRIMDIQPGPVKSALDRLVEHFGGARGLLVLDNCEHLIGGAAELADVLLRKCPTLSVLATTREPLAITGEAGFRVGPLDLPADRASLAEAATSPAVRLFVERAAAALPGFVLDERNLSPIIEICRRLDGMPLALELAAARLRAMTPHQVADLLDDRFRLLTGGSRTSLPRHRTLRGVVEWSWELLTKQERMLARRLAVLAGGADAESAAGVCADEDLPVGDVPYLLASLVEKSLLTVVSGSDGRPRYRMLETVRAYGLAELADCGEAERIDDAFVRYFLGLVTRIEPALRTRDQLHGLAQLNTEHDNVIAALGKAVAAGDARLAADLMAGLVWYWVLTGSQTETVTWSKAVNAMDVRGEPTPAIVGMRLAMLIADHEGDAPAGEYDRLWAEGERVGLRQRFPMLGVMDAIVRLRQGDAERARAAAVRLADSADAWTVAAGRLVLCFVSVHQADAELAEAELVAALDGFRALGERWGTAFTLGLIGQNRMMRGDRAGAVRAFEEAVRIADEVGEPNNLPPMQLMQLAGARGMAGDLDGAERDVRTALANVAAQDVDLHLMGLCVLIHIHVARQDLPAARVLATEAAGLLDDTHRNPSARGALAIAESRIALAAGELAAAADHLAAALAMSLPGADMSTVAGIGERIAVLVGAYGDDLRAAELLGAAAGIRGLLDQGEPTVRELVAALTGRMGEDGYRTAFARGFDHDRQAAIELLRAAVRSEVPTD